MRTPNGTVFAVSTRRGRTARRLGSVRAKEAREVIVEKGLERERATACAKQVVLVQQPPETPVE
jgi:hypothetical protein